MISLRAVNQLFLTDVIKHNSCVIIFILSSKMREKLELFFLTLNFFSLPLTLIVLVRRDSQYGIKIVVIFTTS